MLRAVLVLGGTAAGLAALLSFKTHDAGADAAPAAPAPATSQAAAGGSAQASAAATAPAAGKSPAAGKTTAAGQSPAAGQSASGQAPAAVRTVTGTVAPTQYGPMQVQVTLAGKKITGVTVLQRTNDGSESDQIDATAIPKLTSETLTAQSAGIDAVSGASYTSSGYIKSLQSALDKA